MQAPYLPHQRLAQTISNLFHPLFTLTFVAWVVCLCTSISLLPWSIKLFFLGTVFFYSFLLPLLAIVILHYFHIIGHWALRDRRDRTLPFLVNFISYSFCAYALYRADYMPSWVLVAYFGSSVLTLLAWIISFWWKISAHASANMAAAVYFLMLLSYFPDEMPKWLPLTAVVIVGAIASSRVYLGRHTLAQVGGGALLGIASMAIAEMCMWHGFFF